MRAHALKHLSARAISAVALCATGAFHQDDLYFICRIAVSLVNIVIINAAIAHLTPKGAGFHFSHITNDTIRKEAIDSLVEDLIKKKQNDEARELEKSIHLHPSYHS